MLNKKQAKILVQYRARIAALPLDAGPEQVIEAVRGLPRNLWEVLDNEIGNCHRSAEYNNRGGLVRRVRNWPGEGEKMFAALGRAV